jgi:8-oxo-dGTP pyrophosphatase MutT (NUDIX family)
MSEDFDQDVWIVHGSRNIYKSEWVELWMDDVEVPGGARFEHHVIRYPRESVYALVTRDDHLLMLWRHRFITNVWGWEVPAGWVDSHEDPTAAVRREVQEETGWCPRHIKKLAEYNAQSGITNMHFSLFLMDDAVKVGERKDIAEASKLEWVPLSELPAMIRAGKIQDGPSLLAATYFLAICQS